ncbi:hypothetical protein CALVIDRAFT_597395 [Calocera viscosa TUFC12733]|uniref:Uncharacterized protein n=1 Tax=Calocera viscosa (strain TUFC12733) TaxID=1330018 RepID=A0A167N8L5_CALVF|nr:hypothetical protein CALVIDRAFT_597395 [Calocera viscosa TUFC12733]
MHAAIDFDFDLGGVHASIANALQQILIDKGESIGVDQADVLAKEANILSFQLQVSCTRCRPSPVTTTLPTCATIPPSAPHKLWHSVGHQAHSLNWVFDLHTVTEPNIVLLKLRWEQEVHAMLHCVHACAQEHTRWCPVPSLTYRSMPHIEIGWREEWVEVGREEREKRYEEMRELHGL